MNINNIYFTQVMMLIERKPENDIYDEVTFEPVKMVLVKKSKSGKFKDLNSGETYQTEYPSNGGTLFVRGGLTPFNHVLDDKTQTHLSKRKIKQIGNQYLYKKEEM